MHFKIAKRRYRCVLVVLTAAVGTCGTADGMHARGLSCLLADTKWSPM